MAFVCKLRSSHVLLKVTSWRSNWSFPTYLAITLLAVVSFVHFTTSEYENPGWYTLAVGGGEEGEGRDACMHFEIFGVGCGDQPGIQDFMQSNIELVVMQFLQQHHAVLQLSTNQLVPPDISHSTYEISAISKRVHRTHIIYSQTGWLYTSCMGSLVPSPPQQLLLLVA